jgi:hypothetical protein
MGYAIPKNKSAEEMYAYISNKVRWKKVWGDNEPSIAQKDLIKECLDLATTIQEVSITRLANLIMFADAEDLRSKWADELLILSSGKKREKGSPTLKSFCATYGDVEGAKRYNKFVSDISVRAKENTVFGSNYYIKKGLSKEEAIKRAKEDNSNRSQRRWDKLRKDGVNLSEYCKSIMPHSKGYYLYDNLSAEDAELLRKEEVYKCVRGKDFYIEKYGKEKGMKLYNDRTKRRYATMLKNNTGVFSTNKGMASSWSLDLFIPLCNWLHNLGYNKTDIQLGLKEYRGERWIRYEGNKYFLYDFCFLPGNVIIEYHGTTWHPKSDGTWAEDSPLKQNGHEARQRDEFKVKLAESAGYKVLEIWSDEDLNESIERCKQFIREHGLPKVQD